MKAVTNANEGDGIEGSRGGGGDELRNSVHSGGLDIIDPALLAGGVEVRNVLGFRVERLEFRVWGLGLRVQGLGCRDKKLGVRV